MYSSIQIVYDALRHAGMEDPLIETLKLLDIFSKRGITEADRLITEKRFDPALIADKRKQGVPFEYIVDMAPFMGEFFYCSNDTLIPREETELLAGIALNFIKEKQQQSHDLKLIDMGTGCGNIAVSLVLNSKNTTALASDLNPETIAVTRKNVTKFNLEERITLYQGDLFEPISGKGYEGDIDIIVCNPPYIPSASLKNMSPEIIGHEPKEAFDAGPFGLDFFRRLLNDAIIFLKPNGILVFEIGAGQEKLVTRLFKKKEEYNNIQYYDDGEQIRVISAIRQPD
jgi:release factor glutamine methyltransferase